jgi:hypothetical protein
MAEVLAVKNDVPLPRDFNVAIAKSSLGEAHSQADDDFVCSLSNQGA